MNLLPVGEINLKACALEILPQIIIRHTQELNPDHIGNLLLIQVWHAPVESLRDASKRDSSRLQAHLSGGNLA